MLRQVLIYSILSVIIVLFAKYAHLLIVYINFVFTYINALLAPIFSHSSWGIIVRNILVLMAIPLITAAIPALAYRLIKGKHMPHFMAITWVLWAIVVLSSITIR